MSDCIVSCLVFFTGRLRERASIFENPLVQVRLKGKALHPLGVSSGSLPAGREHGVDRVNDPVVTDGVGGIGRAAGVIVELAYQGVIRVNLPELGFASDLVAAEGFEFSVQLVGVKILGDDVGFNDFFGQDTGEVLNGGIGRSEEGKWAVAHEQFCAVSLVDGIFEGVKIVVLLDVELFFVLQNSEMTVADGGPFHVAKGSQNRLVAVLRQFAGVRRCVKRRHAQRCCRWLRLDGRNMKGRGCAPDNQIESNDSGSRGQRPSW